MKVVFFGTPHFVIPVLQSLIENFEVVGVVTTPDTPLGRKKVMTPTPVKQFALNHKIPIFTLEQLTNDQRQMTKDQPDCFITAAYGHLIPENVLQIPQHGSLNIHPSLLPKYRGPSPIQTAILNGDKETGVTIIKMDEKLDHGPIIAQKKVTLNGNETFEYLHTELFQLAADLLPSTIEQLNNGTITVIPQDESQAIYCKKITKEDGYFDIDNPPEKDVLDRMIRAYYPWPTAWSKWPASPKLQRGEQMSSRSASGGANGKWQIVKLLPDKRIQLEGGKPMSIKDFLNGYPEMREKLHFFF